MYPVLLHLGPVTVYSYGACVVLSLVVGFGALALATFRLKLSPLMLVIPGIAGPAFFIGSRLGFILTDPSVCRESVIRCITRGGMLFAPGFLFALVATVVMALILRLPVLGALDAMTVGTLASGSIGRIGCFLAGCCFGNPSTLPWAVVFPKSDLMPPGLQGVPVHPIQLYLSLCWAMLAAILAWRARTRRFSGELTVAGIAAYAAVMIPDHFLRWCPSPSLASLVFWGVIASVATALLCGLEMAFRSRRTSELTTGAPRATGSTQRW